MFEGNRPNSFHPNPDFRTNIKMNRRFDSNRSSVEVPQQSPLINQREMFQSMRGSMRIPSYSSTNRFRKCIICSSTYKAGGGGGDRSKWRRVRSSPSSDHIHFITYGDDIECGYGCGSKLESMLAFLILVLLISVFALTVFWIQHYRGGFGFKGTVQLRFNWHPVLMTAGLVTISGLSMILPKLCFCFKPACAHRIHTVIHCFVIPCVVLGLMTVMNSHSLSVPQMKNFTSIHSWIGLVTIAFYAIQCIMGVFTCFVYKPFEDHSCFNVPASFAGLHKYLGVLSIALSTVACISGLSITATKNELSEERLYQNSLGIMLLVTSVALSGVFIFSKN